MTKLGSFYSLPPVCINNSHDLAFIVKADRRGLLGHPPRKKPNVKLHSFEFTQVGVQDPLDFTQKGKPVLDVKNALPILKSDNYGNLANLEKYSCIYLFP